MTRAHGMTRYRRGPDENGTPGKPCRCTRCRETYNNWARRRRRMIAYGRWDGPRDPTGTRRRLQALMCCGYSLPILAAQLGCDRRELRRKLHERGTVTAATARAVADLYDRLWDQPPPQSSREEKSSASRSRNYARERGWPPPAAWDDDPGPHWIDDPAATPSPLWDAAPAAPPKRTPASLLVAAAIRQARERAELSQRTLAAEVGVTESYIQLIEYGKRNPSTKVWVQLELTLGPLGIVREAPGPEEGETENVA